MRRAHSTFRRTFQLLELKTELPELLYADPPKSVRSASSPLTPGSATAGAFTPKIGTLDGSYPWPNVDADTRTPMEGPLRLSWVSSSFSPLSFLLVRPTSSSGSQSLFSALTTVHAKRESKRTISIRRGEMADGESIAEFDLDIASGKGKINRRAGSHCSVSFTSHLKPYPRLEITVADNRLCWSKKPGSSAYQCMVYGEHRHEGMDVASLEQGPTSVLSIQLGHDELVDDIVLTALIVEATREA